MKKLSFKCATSNLIDQVILVDENDHPIGTMDKVEAHRGVGQLHRAISAYIFRPDPRANSDHGNAASNWQLLLQQRSPTKIVGAYQWANSACGNVRPGESYRECAYRRLKEELGIPLEALDLTPLYKFCYQVRCNDQFSEHEIDQVFVGVVEKLDLLPNSAEVITTKWLDFALLVEAAREHQWQSDQEVIWQVGKEKFELAPWFVQMLGDDQLLNLLLSHLERSSS